jgi:hypothetical protein
MQVYVRWQLLYEPEFLYLNSQLLLIAIWACILITPHSCLGLDLLCSTDKDGTEQACAIADVQDRNVYRVPGALDQKTIQFESNDTNNSANTSGIYQWLLSQQSQMGILGNQENEYFSGLYTNALATICYIYQGDIERAEKVFSFFNRHLDSVAKTPPGGFPQFWEANTGQPHLDSDRWIGDNAWLLIALNHYHFITGKDTFEEMRLTIAEWLISLQDTDGGIQSGFNQDGLMYWKSTEGNLDCYAALIDYPQEREKINRFLEEKMWIPSEGRFRMGSTVSESALDCLSWGVAALGSEYSSALQYAETVFLCQQISDATGNTVTGFCDFMARDRIWLEGTGQMVVAYNISGQPDKALQFLQELDKAVMTSSRFPGTVGLPCHTNNPAWTTGSTTIFVPSQAWYLFGAWKFNPMNYSYPRINDFNKDGTVNLKDFCILAQYWHQDESSAGIAPLPVSDGKINFKDLVVLTEYWLKDFRLIAHWKLDETIGSIANDSAGYHNGTCHGEPLWRPTGGKVNGALKFDGTYNYVSTPLVLNPAGGPFSVFAWVKASAPGQVIISQTGGADWLLTDSSQGYLGTALKASGRFGRPLYSQTIIIDGNWHQVGLTWDGSQRILYVDGIEAAKDTQSALEGSEGGLHISAGKNADAGSLWSGLIDDVRIYSCALNPDEVVALYKQ